MPKIRVRDVDLHYIVAGEGPNIVMVHGFLGNLAVWHLQILPQLRSRFRITTYDLRGHGRSQVTKNGYTAEHMAYDLKGLLDALDIQDVLLVGHSFGADICLYFSLLWPNHVQGVVAIEPGLAALVGDRKKPSWEGWAYWVEKLEETGLKVPPDKRTDLDYLFTLSIETPKFYGPARSLPRKREPLINLIKNTSLIEDYEVVGPLSLDRIPDLITPVLLIYGEHSHFLSSYRYLHQHLPNCRTSLLTDGEHFGPLEKPDLLVEQISDFADELMCRKASTEAPPDHQVASARGPVLKS